MKLSRRKLATSVTRRKLAKSMLGAALATTATQQLAAQSPTNAEQIPANQGPGASPNAGANANPNASAPADPLLEAALQEQRAMRQAMDEIEMPMTTQPAVHFRPRT